MSVSPSVSQAFARVHGRVQTRSATGLYVFRGIEREPPPIKRGHGSLLPAVGCRSPLLALLKSGAMSRQNARDAAIVRVTDRAT